MGKATLNNKNKSDNQITRIYKYAHVDHRAQKWKSKAIRKIRILRLYLFTKAVNLHPVVNIPYNCGKRKILVNIKNGRSKLMLKMKVNMWRSTYNTIKFYIYAQVHLLPCICTQAGLEINILLKNSKFKRPLPRVFKKNHDVIRKKETSMFKKVAIFKFECWKTIILNCELKLNAYLWSCIPCVTIYYLKDILLDNMACNTLSENITHIKDSNIHRHAP